jgi:hypothetical protein
LLAQEENEHVLNELDSSLSSETRKKWLDTEELAMHHRGDYLKIYAVNSEQGEDCICVINIRSWLMSTTGKAPANSDHLLKLVKTTDGTTPEKKSISWLQTGLTLEAEQYVYFTQV